MKNSVMFYCFFCFLILFSCKKNEINTKKKYTPTIENKITKPIDSIREIYIGKKFYSGDELYDYVLTYYKDLKEIDSLAYGIYRNDVSKSNVYIFTLEQFVKNEDVEEWKIIDTLNIENYNPNDFIVQENIIDKKVSLKVFWKSELLKSWAFTRKTINLANTSWGLQCTNRLTFLDIDDQHNGYLFLYSNNSIYINVAVVRSFNNEKEYYLKFKNTNSQKDYDPDYKHTIDEDISKTENIAKLIINKNKMQIEWYGLYNTKTQSRDFVDEFIGFRENGSKKPIIYTKCED